MQGYRPEQTMSGSWGELWIDGDYMAEVVGFEAKVTLDKQEVNMTRRLAKGYKVTGFTCKGTIKLNKVSSYFIEKMNSNMKAGKQTVCTVISKLNDPDAVGAERIAIKDAVFDELTLANWEAKKICEESIPFTFSDWDILDTAN